MIERRKNQPDKMEWVPGSLAMIVTIMVALATLTPYAWPLPEKNMNLIVQAQTTLWNGWLLILGFYFGTSATSRKTEDIMATQAQTAKVAGDTLAATMGAASAPPGPVTLTPGEEVKVKAEEPPMR